MLAKIFQIFDVATFYLFKRLCRKTLQISNADWRRVYNNAIFLYKTSIDFNNSIADKLKLKRFLLQDVKSNNLPIDMLDVKHYNALIKQKKSFRYSPFALIDFLVRDSFEFIDPHANFSGAGYIQLYPDVALNGINPYLHYLKNGKSEGRTVFPSQLKRQQKPCFLNKLNTAENIELALVKSLWILCDQLDEATFKILDKYASAFNQIIVQTNVADCEKLGSKQAAKKNVLFTNSLNESIEHILLTDWVLKLNLTNSVGATNQATAKELNLLLTQLELEYLLSINSKIEAIINVQSDVNLIGCSQFFELSSTLFEETPMLLKEFSQKHFKNVNFAIPVNGSYWLNTKVLALYQKTQKIGFGDKVFHQSVASHQTQFAVSGLDVELALIINKHSPTVGVIESTQLNHSNKYVLFKLKDDFSNNLPNSAINFLYAEREINSWASQVENSDHFNAQYYAEENGLNKLTATPIHYLRYGAFNGFNPSSTFDGNTYFYTYAKQHIVNPLCHFLVEGGNGKHRNFPVTVNEELKENLIKSQLFDEQFYQSHVEIQNSRTSDFLNHYLYLGWKHLLSPNKNFSPLTYYSKLNYGSKISYPPLVHAYILGSNTNQISKKPTQVNKGASKKTRAILFAGFDVDGLIDPYVKRYIKELSCYGDVYFLGDCVYKAGELNKLKPYVKEAWALRHGAYDFGSYKLLANQLVGWQKLQSEYDEVLLVNDSCYLLTNLNTVFDKMDNTECDFWGLQATCGIYDTQQLKRNTYKEKIELNTYLSTQIKPLFKLANFDFLIGSYFLCFRKNVVRDLEFQNFINNIIAEKNKKNIIVKYEIGLTQLLLQKGYVPSTFIDDIYPFHPIYSNQYFELLNQGFPLLKKYLLSNNHYKIKNLAEWPAKVEKHTTNLVIAEINNNLARTCNQELLYNSLYEPNFDFDAVKTLKNDEKVAKDYNVWVFPVCGFTHHLDDNLRALFETVKNDASIKKLVLYREKRVELKGENVLVLPLNSKQGIKELLQAGVVFLKHTTYRNVGFELDWSKRKVINLWHGIPLKKIGLESKDQVRNKTLLLQENKRYDAVIASSNIDAQKMQLAFAPIRKDKVWITGLPRIDLLKMPLKDLPADYQIQIKKLEELKKGKLLVAYLPTFRNSGNQYRLSVSESLGLNEILKVNNAVLGVRDHLAQKEHGFLNQLSGLGVIDMSIKEFPNVECVLRAADVLITDYSSCFIDYMQLGKPMLSFAYDLDEYASKERGFFYEFNEVFPGEVCLNFNDLKKKLNDCLSSNYKINMQKYKTSKKIFFHYQDAANSNRVVNLVKEGLKK